MWYKNFNKKKFTLNIQKNFIKNQIDFIHHKEKFNLNTFKKEHKQIFIYIKKIDKVVSNLRKDTKIKTKDIYKIINSLSVLIKKFNVLKKNNLISKGLKELLFFLKFYLKNPKKIYKYKKFRYFKNFWGNTVINVSLKKY